MSTIESPVLILDPHLSLVQAAEPVLGHEAVFVLSAGPNGRVETAFDQAADAFTVGGDDIAARIK